VSSDDPYFEWDWVLTHLDDVWARLLNHVLLTVIAVAIGFAISFPLALLAVRRRWLYAPIASFTGILYTIPSLALFALLVPVPGFGFSIKTAEVGLVSYTLLILIRNTVAGLQSVPPDVKEAAVGMGLSPRQVLWRVEVPLALPIIVAGLRVATVTTIGLVTVTSLIGLDNLGQFILDGINRLFRTPLVLGAVLSIALAVVADASLLGVQRLVAPWTRVRGREA
jgi:osmoprotectant transport system permease protein